VGAELVLRQQRKTQHLEQTLPSFYVFENSVLPKTLNLSAVRHITLVKNTSIRTNVLRVTLRGNSFSDQENSLEVGSGVRLPRNLKSLKLEQLKR